MHHARAVFGGDEVAAEHAERAVVGAIGKIWEERRVATTDEFVPLQRADLLCSFKFALVRLATCGCHHVANTVQVVHAVLHVWRDGERKVGRKRPRCGRPREQTLAGLQQEADSERRVLHHLVGVIHARLRVGQRGFERPRIRQHAEPFVDETLVPQRLERPHDALHVRKIERLVVVVEVNPSRLSRDVFTPLARVLQHRSAAVVVELVDAEVGDGLAARDAELSLSFGLGGQTVAVPPETALDALAAHRAVAGYGVFDETRQQVAVVRKTVGKRRAVVKDELAVGAVRASSAATLARFAFASLTAALSRVLVNGGFEGAVALPICEYLLFDLGQVRLGRDVRVRARHQSSRVTGRYRRASSARSRERSRRRSERCRAGRCSG